jgi:MFS family permease
VCAIVPGGRTRVSVAGMATTRSGRPALALAVLCTAQFVDVMGVTVVVVALPTMRTDLDATASQVQLVVSVYAFLFGCLLLAGGRAADRWGRLRLFRGGLAGFGVASLVCAVAPSAEVLVAGRAVQGASAAAIVPAALALVTETFTGDAERRRALAVWTAAGAGGGALGLFAGGVTTDLVGWRWIFVANVPLVLFSLLLAGWCLPPDAPAARQRGPLVPRGVLTLPLVVACAVAFVNTATTSSAGTLVTLQAQDVEGLSASGTGLLLLPFSLSVVAGSALGARLLGALGPRAAAVGLAARAAGIGCCAVAVGLAGAATVALLGVGVAVSGTGLGVAAVASTATGTSGVPPAHLGSASGMINTATQLGTAAGTAALLGLADAVARSSGGAGGAASAAALTAGNRAAFVVAVLLALVTAAAVAVALRRRPGGDVTHAARGGTPDAVTAAPPASSGR